MVFVLYYNMYVGFCHIYFKIYINGGFYG